MTLIACTTCGKQYPDHENPFLCECGGKYDFIEFPIYSPLEKKTGEIGVWQYRKSLGVNTEAKAITLGEGETPLVQIIQHSKSLWLKLESENPTGSYKDRGSTILVSHLKDRGVEFSVEDSSGNAGASFAAYCAKGSIKCRIFVPESASGPKRTQIEMFGAELIRIPGPRSEAAKAVLAEVKHGVVYGSHAYMPFGLTGIATIAYELVNQLGQVPGRVIAPVGHGGLLYGIMRGFEAMMKAGTISREPYYLGVQSESCAPIADAYLKGHGIPEQITSAETLAEGVKVSTPVRGAAILSRLKNNKGKMMSITEVQLRNAYIELASLGFYCEPTSALVWAAAGELDKTISAPTVAIITGSGYKSNLYLTGIV